MKQNENLQQENCHTPEALVMRNKNNDRGSSTCINTVITTHSRLKHKDDIDSCPHENAVNTSESELSDISMANRSTSSERSRACSVRKLLPKQSMLRCCTVIRMVLHELSQPATREIMLQELRANKQFQSELLSISMLSSETKEVNSMIRNVKSLALKNPLALKKKVNQIKKKYTLQKIQLVTGMCYSEVHRILNPKSSKGGVRKISEVN